MKQSDQTATMQLKTRRMSFVGHIAPALVLTLLLAPVHAVAAETSWVKALHAEARMVAADKRRLGGKNVLMAGIHVRLDPGWKTYWRSPGDAGLPPSFDWTGSANLKSARVLWPAPQRFADPYGSSIGYHDEVVFPVMVEADDAGRPVALSVKFDYAVCKDICVPAHATLGLKLAARGQDRSPHDRLVVRYLKKVPVNTAPGAKKPSVAAVKIKLAQPKPQIMVDAVFPGGTKDADLFIEGPEFFYLPLPVKVAEEAGNRIRYKVDLTKGDDPKDLKGKTLTFTLISAGGHSETTHAVD